MKIYDKTMELIIKEEEKCIGCKQCMKGCPMLDKFCSSPKELLGGLKDTGEFNYSLPYSCMLCGYCTEVCPASVDLTNLFLQLRRDTVNIYNGKLPRDLNTFVLDFHQKFSFSKLFTSDIENLQSDTIFFPGCGLLSYSQSIVENTYEYLRSKIQGIGIYTKCCGKPTNALGKENKFNEYYSILDKEFKDKGVKRIITGCQNCFNTISCNSKDIEVISLWQVLAELGIPEEKKNICEDVETVFTIHDPCTTRGQEIVHNSVRKVLDDLGLKVEEMTFNKDRTLCCGSGGMVQVTQSQIANEHILRRANEAKTEYIITYCQECVESMRKGGKKSYHILDLLFRDDFRNTKQINQKLLSRWINRYKVKNIGKH
ncbi:Fe-S oxidoreductase [Hathewaya proteolytica DSM 3090]|uniref:Fe-S oxidoreductase n=1 Tax=Hathewaya proteolytica DSM 3090 TaxID=1121331 RepID=A0A1M6KGV2_9CLOT|nr:(Fe-S)-binding protein [Hathewaya proteolytica]SHJ58194.1 Fe-S oxidoreductase [Hathewaya proteolytica DSM 3090]